MDWLFSAHYEGRSGGDAEFQIRYGHVPDQFRGILHTRLRQAIKPLSWGTWPKEGKRTREWWYRSVEEPGDIELAMRFALSQPPVIAGIPPSFLDLLARTIEAASRFTPLDATGMEKLKLMASDRESIFLAEERQVALNLPGWQPVYPDSPHECGGHHQLG